MRVDRLALHWGRLELSGVQVTRPGELHLKVERVVVDYSFAGIWRRRLDAVTLHQPDLEWDVTNAGGEKAVPWASQPPLRVRAWTIEAGRLLLTLGKDRLLLRQFEATGNLDARFTVAAAARLGKEPGEALALAGHGNWEGQPELTLTSLLWADRSLLQAPVTLVAGGQIVRSGPGPGAT